MKLGKRIGTALLALCMVLGLVPVLGTTASAAAAEGTQTTPSASTPPRRTSSMRTRPTPMAPATFTSTPCKRLWL